MAVLLGNIKDKYTLSELKGKNPSFFDKKTLKVLGIYKSKLMDSPKLKTQVLIEAAKAWGGDRVYTVRQVDKHGDISRSKNFDTIREASEYIGKNIIL